MNRDDIIAMAREAGCIPRRHPEHWDDVQVFATPDVLERFAALIAEPLQSRIKDLYRQLDAAEKRLDEQYKLGMESEREACAKLADKYAKANEENDNMATAFIHLADAIRARGEK